MVNFQVDISTSLYLYGDLEEIVTYDGSLIGLDDEGEPKEQIGWFTLTHITEYDSVLMDVHSHELHELDVAVRSLEESWDNPDLFPLTVWYLERLVVAPEYRRRGVGSNCVYKLLRHTSSISATGLFVVGAKPLDDDGHPVFVDNNDESAFIQLRAGLLARWFIRLGFDTLPISQSLQRLNPDEIQTFWYYRELDQQLPKPPASWVW